MYMYVCMYVCMYIYIYIYIYIFVYIHNIHTSGLRELDADLLLGQAAPGVEPLGVLRPAP